MMIGSSFFFVKYILNMKSENAFDYLCAGLCHVSDGELLDGHRVGCADLVYYDSAVSAIEQAERDVEERMRRTGFERCQTAFPKLVKKNRKFTESKQWKSTTERLHR